MGKMVSVCNPLTKASPRLRTTIHHPAPLLPPTRMSEASPHREPSDEDLQAWLATTEGAAAMKEVMQDVVAGKFGELTPEVMEMARSGVHKHEVAEMNRHLQQRLKALMQRLAEKPHEWPENSRWAHAHALNEEAKAIMDLMLEMPEPFRTAMMQEMVPIQQMIEKVESETD